MNKQTWHMTQEYKLVEYKREMLTNAIERYLNLLPASKWTEEQAALWHEVTDVNDRPSRLLRGQRYDTTT